ncbi:PREDICTED: tyrosine-protein kinase receptor Tie-1-like isoform X2 [Acropora digitifera]|nr:PREDICTED: tyrosine-protein kinase receptor Tie-1-like isoform X2 [Acropora digitifera]
MSELELMKNLKPHPHVVKLLGCVTKSDPLLVLIEYIPYGDLLGFLRKSRGLNDSYYKDPDVKPRTNLTSQQMMQFAWQIADGMHFLSSNKIIHRDLAARNVLVGEGEKCKVTDFGLARDVSQVVVYTKRSRGRLPVKWTAPEALLFGSYTTLSDVWSFGVVLYEIFTVGGCPYPGINGHQMADVLKKGYRMPKPKHVDQHLYDLMYQCWQQKANDRPMFSMLKTKLSKMIQNNEEIYINMREYNNDDYGYIDDLFE